MRPPERFALSALDAADEFRALESDLLDAPSWPGSSADRAEIAAWQERLSTAFALVGRMLESLDGLQAELAKVRGESADQDARG
jgi:hypothetical protein